MELPKFLLGDNTDFSESIYIIHTHFPRFIINLTNDEVELFEEIASSEKADLEEEMKYLVAQAYTFYEREVNRFEEE